MNTAKPHFVLTRIYDDGTQEAAEILPVTELPVEASMGRRSFLGAGLTIAGVLKSMTEAVAAESRVPKVPVPTVIPAHAGKVTALAISPDGKTLVSGGADKAIKLWSLTDRVLIQKVDGPNGSILALAISPDGQTLVSGSTDPDVQLWRLPEGTLQKSRLGISELVGSLVFSPNGKTVAAAGGSRGISVHDTQRGNLVRTLQWRGLQATALTMSPSGEILVSGWPDSTVKLWNVAEGKLLTTLKKHTALIHAVAMNADGALLASGSFDNTIVLWDMKDYAILHTLVGHTGNVNALAIHGNRLASASSDGTIKLWSLPDGKLLKTMMGHTDAVWTLAITPDGNTLVSGGFDGTIRLWTLSNGEASGMLGDLAAAPPRITGATYQTTNSRGQVITFTLPCGSPIPAGAVCTCNCVPGTYVPIAARPVITKQVPEIVQRPPMQVESPVYGPHSKSSFEGAARPSSRGYSGGTICTCNKICTCIPVCQAHRLLHPDPVVRTMAEELLFGMGKREFEYMEWAASRATDALESAIRAIMRAIGAGVTNDPSRLPTVSECVARLGDRDEIVGIMAAQMIAQRCRVHDCRLTPIEACQVESLLDAAQRRPWYLR